MKCVALVVCFTYLSLSQGRLLSFTPPLILVKNSNADNPPLSSSPSVEREGEERLPSLCSPAGWQNGDEASGGAKGPLWCVIMGFSSPQSSNSFPYGKRNRISENLRVSKLLTFQIFPLLLSTQHGSIDWTREKQVQKRVRAVAASFLGY